MVLGIRLKPVFWRYYHRYYDRNTSQQISQSGITTVLGFFGGSRFVPIVTAFAAIFLGVLMFSFGQAYKPAFIMLVDL